jgi:hypothetical protein
MIPTLRSWLSPFLAEPMKANHTGQKSPSCKNPFGLIYGKTCFDHLLPIQSLARDNRWHSNRYQPFH